MRQPLVGLWNNKVGRSLVLGVIVAVALLVVAAPAETQVSMAGALPDVAVAAATPGADPAGEGPGLDAVTMSILPSSQIVALGSQATVNIYSSGSEPVWGVDFQMSFDNSILATQPTPVASGALLSGRGYYPVRNCLRVGVGCGSSNLIWWAWTLNDGGAALSDPGVLGSITFNTVALGTANITWSSCVWSDIDGTETSCTTANASVTVGDPTAVELLSFTATEEAEAIRLSWETASETDNLGFNLYRARKADGHRTKINAEMIPSQVAPGSPFGAEYEYADGTIQESWVYYYWLEAVDVYGQTGLHGPLVVRVFDTPREDYFAEL